ALAGKSSFLRHPVAKSVAIERFGGRLGKERMRQHARHRGLVDFARGRGTALVVLRLASAQADEVVDQRVAGPGIAGDELGTAVDEGDVGDAAQIKYA